MLHLKFKKKRWALHLLEVVALLTQPPFRGSSPLSALSFKASLSMSASEEKP